jgi:metal-dependent HD superfamily phosphatase/phosphodiesterase
VISLLKILELLKDFNVKINRRERTVKILRGDQLVVLVKFYDDDIFNQVHRFLTGNVDK